MRDLFQDELLNGEVRAAIHDFALAARQLLMAEARDLLEGDYGLRANGTLEPPANLPALQDPEAMETYQRLKRFLNDEVSAGLEREEAVEKLIKEVTFTHLNRLVAFKMMEVSKLIRETVGRGPDSNGLKFYVVDHPQDEALWNQGQKEQVYRHFLIWQTGQIAREVSSLFDPDDLSARFFPRPGTLASILNLINNPALTSVWDVEETIGWIYEYFNEQEKEDIDHRLQKGEKVLRKDLSAKTQLFTPRWVVRFLVENSLGRLWVQMHPDSDLKFSLKYLVPQSQLAAESAQNIIPAKEVSLLDPACGTMHFGLVAYELFDKMYREEIIHAGELGWPETPSVISEKEIPSAILRDNIYGIDIDLRAVQLSALTLYLKAKRGNKAAEITDHNLACADILPIGGAELASFIKEMQFKPIYERLLKKLWEKLENINQVGSLLRLEKEISLIIQEERKRFEREGRQLDLFGNIEAEFESDAAVKEYWDIMAAQLLQAIDHFTKLAAKQGHDVRFFTKEATKGWRILSLMTQKYSIVVTNPPYLDSRDYNPVLKNFIEAEYPDSKRNLYSTFVERCLEFLEDNGRFGIITGQSFMFISSFENFRKKILQEHAIECLLHFDYGLFKARVDTTAYVLRHEANPTLCENNVGTYFRLVHEPDADGKRLAFENALAALKNGS